MKISSYLHAAKLCLLALSVFGFVACDSLGGGKKGSGGGGTGNNSDSGLVDDPTVGTEGEPINEVLSPEASVSYMQGTAETLINLFNTSDQRAAVKCADLLIYEFSEYTFDWDKFDEYFEGSGRYDGIWDMASYVSGVASGSRLPTDLVDFSFSFANESAIFEADNETRTWEYRGKANDNSIQLIYTYNKKKYVAKVWGEGTVRTYTTNVAFEDFDKTYEAKIPEKIIATFTEGGTEHIRVTIAISLAKNQYVKADITGKVANITWTANTNVGSESATFASSVKYGNTSMFTAYASVPGYVTLPKEDGQTWEEWINLYGDQYEYLIAQAQGVSCKVTLLDRAQIKATASDPNALYTGIRDWSNTYDDGSYYDHWWEYPEYTRSAQMELAEIFNSNLTCALYYNSDLEQVQFQLAPKQYTTTYYDYDYGYDREATYYEVTPIMYFPATGQSYEFGEYFTEDKYNDILGMAKDVANLYIDLFEYWNIDHIE